MFENFDFVLSEPELDVLNALLPKLMLISDDVKLSMYISRIPRQIPIQLIYLIEHRILNIPVEFDFLTVLLKQIPVDSDCHSYSRVSITESNYLIHNLYEI